MTYLPLRHTLMSVAAASLIALTLPVEAAEFTVDSTADYVDRNIGDGICEAEIVGLNKCTLRAAIQEANARPGFDRIVIPAGLYLLSLGGSTDDTGAQGDLDILDDVELVGAGTNETIIDGNSIDRVFDLPSNLSQIIQATIKSLTIQHGLPNAPSIPLQVGGGISSSELLTLENVVLKSNKASSGGGIYSNGTLVASNVTIESNTATQGGGATVTGGESYFVASQFLNNDAASSGGAIAQSAGTLELSHTLISGNKTAAGGTGGGGINSTGALYIYDSTFSNNSSGSKGGALSITNSGVANISGSLFSGNSATGAGGAAYVDAKLFAVNSTISGNTAGSGGGLYQGAPSNSSISSTDGTNLTIAFNSAATGANTYRSEGLLNLRNSIVSNPIGSLNCYGEIDSLGYNIDSDDSCAMIAVGDQVGVDPKLNSLAANGGATLTHAFASDSPAIDNGANSFCPFSDQRVYRRGDGKCDIGAFEANSVAMSPGLVKFEKASYTVNESDKFVDIAVLRSGGSEGAVSVKYITRSGTAKDGADFKHSEGVLNWADGDSTPRVISITIIDDVVKEKTPELASLSLFGPVGGAALGSPILASIEITDNDWKPGILEFSSPTFSVTENSAYGTVTVTRTGGSDGDVSATFATSDNTATAGVDYTATSGKVTLASGQTSATIQIPMIDDSVYEGTEAISLTLSNPTNGATLGAQSTSTLYIFDNEVKMAGSIQFANSAESVSESAGAFGIKLTRAGGSNGKVTAKYLLTQWTATPGVDFTTLAGTVEFADGETEKTIDTSVIDDLIYEGDEYFTLKITEVISGSIGVQSETKVTIVDNDPAVPGTVQFASDSYSATETSGTVSLSVVRVDGKDGPISVNYSVTGGSASVSSDFTGGSGVLNFVNGQTAATIQINIINDGLAEPSETVIVTLSSPSNGSTLGTLSSSTLTIANIDPVVPATNDNAGGSSDPAPVATDSGKKSVGGGAVELLPLLMLFGLTAFRQQPHRRDPRSIRSSHRRIANANR